MDGLSTDEAIWEEFRHLMPVARRWAYLDHAAVSPLPGPTSRALVEWAEEASVNGNVDWPQWERRVADLRTKAATLLGATTEEIALLRSTSEGVNLVAEGFPWEPGDNVVTLADEFPTNQYPWLNQAGRGVETRRVAVGPEGVALDAIAGACDRRTRIVAISWVSYCTGRRLDLARLAEIAHQRGALLFVDGIQGLGVLPLDVGSTPIDFLAADGHKWLLGPEGAGLFYIRREHLARLRPVGVGWNSVVHARDFSRIELKLKDSAERYEGGSQNMAGMIALGESVALLLRFGVAAIAERIFAITDLACARLSSIGARIVSDRRPESKSGIVVFEMPGSDPAAIRQECLKRNVVLSCRGGRLRISLHAYNSADDVDRLVAAVRGA
ncbi:MAG: aminotransferase class V-fold PLP-dependent enzyme [Pirellulales bacterium]|nr:aminotransferase class V-fold PLP-dependent enzyme [Pirellulales bacterium]MDI9445613.1 aminotransferase class V-fold PLP-dependent enzyme [Planctomycetota bacterium]